MIKLLTKSIAVFVVVILSIAKTTAAEKSITIGMQLEPPNLNPTGGAAAAIDEIVYANLFEGLTRFESDGSVVPSLAKSWTISSDNLTYIFNLNENITFHDGLPMTADDVKFSLDRARSEESTNAQKILFKDIDNIAVVDDLTIQVKLTRPNGSFISNMAWGDAIIVSEKRR